ncbi:type 2 periplasmic-binding domain-containing protein [Burkholderia vietnamiensis]|uniref:hypothetical protein n=1 Tax=Burkholderia vietnamiensis TaxID=60552 RepID=UPI0018DCFD13|nr:hypothetical protein [Burkholderia vietnamiensis]MBH9645826.1 hypothetical protein [Burkholderia vietnamiensis]
MNTRFGTPNTNFGIPRNCSTSSETAVHLPPETLFDFNRNPCSASPKYAGVALIPASMTRFTRPDVAFRPLLQSDVRSHLALAHRKNVRSPAAQQLIRLCRQR